MSSVEIVFNHIAQYPCSSVADVAGATGVDTAIVKNIVQQSIKSGRIKATQSIKGMSAQYVEAMTPKAQVTKPARPKAVTPALTQLKNGSGYAKKPMPVISTPAVIPHKNGTVRETYVAAESNQGRVGANDAFDLPSIANGVETSRRRPSAICVGVAHNGPVGHGQPRRFT